MAVAGILVSARFEKLNELRTAFDNIFSKPEVAAILGEALEIAIFPAYMRLRELTPRGPTGNMVRAANYKVKTYPRDGNAIGLIGYNRSGTAIAASAQGGSVLAGPDRAFHQWWIEYGTQPREINTFSDRPYKRRSKLGKVHTVRGQNAYIASSYNKLGPFRVLRNPSDPGSVTTSPPYNKAFLKKSKNPFKIPAVRPGGVAGVPPVSTAFQQSQGIIGEYLERELGKMLNQAVEKLPVEKTGSLSG